MLSGNCYIFRSPFEVDCEIDLHHTYLDSELIQGLANSDNYDDRLVPHHSYEKWDQQNPLEFKISSKAQQLLDIIDQRIQQKN